MDPNDRLRQGQALGELVTGVRPRRHRRWTVALSAVAVAAATTGAGVAYVALQPEQAKDATTVRCFTSVGLKDTDVGTSTNYRPDDQDAVDVCATLWRAGILHLGAAQPSQVAGPSLGQQITAPPLVGCVFKGGAAVFPGDTTVCTRLHLAPLAAPSHPLTTGGSAGPAVSGTHTSAPRTPPTPCPGVVVRGSFRARKSLRTRSRPRGPVLSTGSRLRWPSRALRRNRRDMSHPQRSRHEPMRGKRHAPGFVNTASVAAPGG
jgi:hypothetical protein